MTKNTGGARFLPESERSKFISLKEAALITEYTPDYIGQLIRAGKIEGQQVYTNVSWVTTEEAVRHYMHSKGKNEESKRPVPFWKNPQWYMYSALYSVIACLGCIFLVLCYIFFVSIDHKVGDASLKNFNVHTYAR